MRTWIYESLVATDITSIGDRIYQASALTEVPRNKHHMIYRVGARTPLLHGEEVPVVVTPFNVFIHDEPGDYGQIDAALALLRVRLTQNPPMVPETRFIRCLWLEDSIDVPEDPLTGTISRFNRMNLIHKP